MLIEQLVVFFTIYESMPDRVERVDHLGIDAPQLHPFGDALCLSWSIGGWVRRAGVVGGSGSEGDRWFGWR